MILNTMVKLLGLGSLIYLNPNPIFYVVHILCSVFNYQLHKTLSICTIVWHVSLPITQEKSNERTCIMFSSFFCLLLWCGGEGGNLSEKTNLSLSVKVKKKWKRKKEPLFLSIPFTNHKIYHDSLVQSFFLSFF